MSRCVPQPVPLLGAVFLFLFTSTAPAQWTTSVPGQMQCQCVQPVVQQVYRTVPVTEYQQVKQTVQRPVYETKWVDREFTEYQPVTETQTADVPYTNYHTVTEHVPVTRDYGRWITQRYERPPQISPWQYDGRPGFTGWWNRTRYSVRSFFTPRYQTNRQYMPNVVTQAVPVTRQVAVQETRKVTYNVTKMVPQTVRRKVAVQNVRYVNEEVTAMRPVTVMRTIPIGTRTAYTYFPYSGATATALGPSPDPLGGAPDRTVDRRNDPNSGTDDRFRRDADSSFNSLDSSQAEPPGAAPATFQNPPPQPRTGLQVGQTEGRQRAEEEWRVVTIPTAARVHRWKARNQTAAQPTDRGVSFADSQP